MTTWFSKSQEKSKKIIDATECRFKANSTVRCLFLLLHCSANFSKTMISAGSAQIFKYTKYIVIHNLDKDVYLYTYAQDEY